MADIPERTQLLIGGTWHDTDEHLDVIAPWDGRLLSRMALATVGDVDRAVAAAGSAKGRLGTLAERAEILDRTAELLTRDRAHLARVIASEAAKPILAAHAEVARAVETFRFAAAEARTLHGETVPLDAHHAGGGLVGFTLREPVGVVAAITPFNFPLNLVAHKLAPAFAAGCPVVLKPAEKTPLSALALVQRMLEAGLPAFATQVVTGLGPVVGASLAAHPGIDALTFTGSAAVGHALAAAAGSRVRVLLELGAPAPLVVEHDADLSDVADRVAAHGFAHAGQSCVSVQRLLVHESVQESLMDLVLPRVRALRLGSPLDETTDLSCLIRPEAAARVDEWIGEAVAAGARLRTGGEREGGALSPAIVDRVPFDMRLWREEAFGPVVAVATFTDTTEAIARIADGPDLIQVGVFTADLERALRYARELRVGTVLCNESPTFRADQMPYGGVGAAGNTREGPRSTIRELTIEKLVVLRASAA